MQIYSDYRVCNKFIEKNLYKAQCGDLWRAFGDGALHYLLYGWRRGLNPNNFFCTSWYLERYADIREAKLNPFAHFLNHGRAEGRLPKPSTATSMIAENAHNLIFSQKHNPGEMSTEFTLDCFQPNNELEHLEEFRWRSHGNDPDWTLIDRVRAGFLRLRFEANYEHIRDSAAREAFVEILFDHQGQGIVRLGAFAFLIRNNQVAVDALLYIENDATIVKINPVNTECDIIVKTVKISTVDLGFALRELYEKYCWKNNEPLRSDQDFFEQIQPAKISCFVRAQTNAFDYGLDLYQPWMKAHRVSPSRRRQLIARANDGPVFSILMPTYRSNIFFLRKAIQSVIAQTYPRWELCISDDGSNDPLLHEFLEQQATNEPRIRYQNSVNNEGIAAASNKALSIASGEFIALLDHDDELALHALSAIAAAIEKTKNVDMLYSDEDKIDLEGNRSAPLFKPDWSPEFFLSCMYTCHLGVYRRTLVENVGRFRSAFDFAQDYDLALRVSAKARAIIHIPDVLYHWRTLPTSTASGADAKPTAELAARRAVQAYVDVEGLSGRVLSGMIPGTHRVKLNLLGSPLISIVIPATAGKLNTDKSNWCLIDLLQSIFKRSTYRRFEIVIVTDDKIDPRLEKELAAYSTVRAIYCEPIINMPRKINLGVAAARGEFVVFLSEETTVFTPGWLEELTAWLQRPGIVGVGGKILLSTDRVYHAGFLLLAQGPSRVYSDALDEYPGLAGSAITHRNYAAVTGECLAVRKTDFDAIGGFDPAFGNAYYDIDLCLKLRGLGRIVYTAFAKLYRHEPVSEKNLVDVDLNLLKTKWSDVLGEDIYYNRNLSQNCPNQITAQPQQDCVY